MYSSDSACVCVQNVSKSYERIFTKILCGEVEREGDRLDFGGDPDSFVDSGSFSMIL